MKKVVSLFLALLLLLPLALLASCSKISASDEEIKEAAESLIKKSLVLNDIYWGKGLAAIEGGEKLSLDYTEADVSPLAGFGITDMNSLKDYTSSVYSENECKNLFSIYLTETKYSDTFGGYSYTETYTRYLCDKEGTLYVYKDIENIIGDAAAEYDCSTIRIKEKTRKTVKIEVDVTVSAPGKEPYGDTVTLEMVYENGSFRLKSPTYISYD